MINEFKERDQENENLDEQSDVEIAGHVQTCNLKPDVQSGGYESDSEVFQGNVGCNTGKKNAATIWRKFSFPSKHRKMKGQNIVTKLPGVIGNAVCVSTPFEAWNCFFTNEVLEFFVKLTNKYIDVIKEKFERDRDAKRQIL